MRTVAYSEVLRGTAALAGLVYNDVSPEESALLRTFHDRRLQVAWEIHDWPELVRTEQRWFRGDYASGTTYAAGVEVFDPATQEYYQALRETTGNAPSVDDEENSAYWAVCATSYSADDWEDGVEYEVGDQVLNASDRRYYQCHTAHTSAGSLDATKFGVLTPFNRYVDYEQSGETVIGEVLRATDLDPRTTTRLTQRKFWLSDEGVQFPEKVVSVWLQFRVRRPELTGEVFESDSVYTSGQQVYFKDANGVGNFYECEATTSAGESPSTTPAKWSVVEIPYFMRGYLVEAAFADWLTADGQMDKAGKHEGMAMEFLELEADKVQRQQGQTRRIRWRG